MFVRKRLVQQKMLSDEWFDLEYVSSIFSCMSQCIRQECNEVVACSGRSGLEPDWDDHNGIQYKPWYEPLSFIPGLKLFTLPEKCPVKISAPLETSFTLSKLCPGAAANLIRISIEELLTAIDVPNKKVTDFTIELKQSLIIILAFKIS